MQRSSHVYLHLLQIGMTDTPVFIVGAPRSGTTLLRNMLNRHPTFAICNETRFCPNVYARRRAFGDLKDGNNGRRLVDEYLATDRIRRLGLHRSEVRDQLLRESSSYRELFIAVLRNYAELQGKKRYGEKTPQHALFSEVLCEWYPGAAIIHLIRDPRDVVGSLQNMAWASKSVVINARAWVRHNAAAIRSNRRPGYLRVLYETLVVEPERELARICAHLGEDYSPLMLAPSSEDITSKPWSKRSQLAVTVQRLGVWRKQLTEEEVALTEWVASEHMAAFGYRREAAAPSPMAIAQGLAVAALDSARRRIHHFPATLSSLMSPTKLAREESWLSRIRDREQTPLNSSE
jgi:hypothetical protein